MDAIPTLPPPETPVQQIAKPASPAFYRRPAILVALIAVVVIIAQWIDSRQKIDQLRTELATSLAAVDVQNKEARKAADQVREAIVDSQVKLGMLEGKLLESQNQQVALEALYQELSRGRDESILADVEQTLLVANQQLLVAGNVKAALIALQAADARLARLDRPQLAGVRKVIARDIERLKLAPHVDVIGISARLDNLLTVVPAMPLAMEVRPAPTVPVKSPAEGQDSAWTRFTRELWRDLRELVRIQNMDRAEVPLLSPAQTFFLSENLKLRLLSARLALLARDEKSFRADLQAARDWLTRYYDVRDRSVTGALDTVRQLNESQISIELPDVAASLDAVRNYRLTRERGRQ